MAKKKTTKKKTAKKEDHSQLVSILSYLVVGIIWYFVDDKVQNKATKFHVKQALVLFIIWIICGIVAGILPILAILIIWIVQLIGVVLLIIGIFNALNEKQKALPIIGGIAKKLKF